MGKMNRWFEQSSGYTPHPVARRDLRARCTCGRTPREDGRGVYLPGAEEDRLALCVCPDCGRLYARLKAGYLPLENPLRCRIVPTADR